MKKIVLEEYSTVVKDDLGRNVPIKSSDKTILKTPLNNQPIGGRDVITYEILKRIDKICEKIDKAEKELILENEEYKFLKDKFVSYTNWNANENIRKFIIKTGEKLEKAEEVK